MVSIQKYAGRLWENYKLIFEQFFRRVTMQMYQWMGKGFLVFYLFPPRLLALALFIQLELYDNVVGTKIV